MQPSNSYLVSLPEELIAGISDFLAEPQYINPLAKACRQLYTVLNPILYRRNRIHDQGSAARWAAQFGINETLDLCHAAGVDLRRSDLGLLHLAAQFGQEDTIRKLLDQHGADSEGRDTHMNWTPLLYATRENLPNTAQMLVDAGASVETPAPEGWRPLSVAASFNALAMITFLLDHGAEIDAISDNGSSALKAAARGGHVEVSQILLERGADASKAAHGGWTPLHSAAKSGNIELAELLVKYGAQLDATQDRGYTPLILAVESMQIPMAEILIKNGADVNGLTGGRWSALGIATDLGHGPMAKKLLENGADHTHEVAEGWSPLNLAAVSGHVEVGQALIEHGANLNGGTSSRQIPILLASAKGHSNFVELLLKNGANIEAKKANGETSLLVAAMKNKPEVVKVLLDNGADHNAVDECSWAFHQMAAHFGYPDVLQVAFEYPAVQLEYRDLDGRTPLFHAVMRGKLNCAAYLLSKGADVNSPDRNGTMPIAMAIRNGHYKVVQTLLQSRRETIDMVSKDVRGRSVFWGAGRCNTPAIVTLLKEFAEDNDIEIPPADISTEGDMVHYSEAVCWCDSCGRCRVHGYPARACRTCNNAGFIICSECVELGLGCRDPHHETSLHQCSVDEDDAMEDQGEVEEGQE